MKKHRHKWKLEWVDAGTLGMGLLWSCECGSCKELKDKKPTLEQALATLLPICQKLYKALYKK